MAAEKKIRKTSDRRRAGRFGRPERKRPKISRQGKEKGKNGGKFGKGTRRKNHPVTKGQGRSEPPPEILPCEEAGPLQKELTAKITREGEGNAGLLEGGG